MTTYTTTQKRAGLNNMNAAAQRSKLGDLVYGMAGGYPLDYPGMIYFVNNVTGSDTLNDGLSWGKPFAQLAAAITAVATFQAAQTDVYTRCIIYVAGTSTTYTNVSTLPQYTDIIGVGATPYGDGAGIPCIGLAGYDGIAGTARGLRLIGLQFQAPTTFYCADFVSLFRSEIAFCTFQSRVTDAAAGIRFTAASSGNYIHHCMWTAGGGAAWAVRGIDIEGASFNNNLFEYNHIVATECGVYIVSTCVDAGGAIFRYNTMGGEDLAIGVDDNATNGTIVYANNSICCASGAGGTLVNDGARRWVANYSANGFSTVTAS